MTAWHRLLERQLQRHFEEPGELSAELRAFVEDVHEAYQAGDLDREMLERSLDLSSEELFEANSELRALMAALPDLVLKLDSSGRIQDVQSSPDGETVIERTRLVGKRLQDAPFLSTSADISDVVQRVAVERSAQSAEYSLHIDGRQKHYEVRLLPFLRDQMIAVVRDVTELRESEQHLTHANDRLRTEIHERGIEENRRREVERQLFHAQKMESLGVLAGGIAHDFNNLLVGILGNASLARIEATLDEPTAELLEEIEIAARRAAELTDQMLSYAGKGKLASRAIDVTRVVDEMLSLLRATVSKKASIQRDFEPDLPAIVGDATQIRQIVMNLITNASEALGGREGTIHIRARAYHVAAAADAPGDLEPGAYVVFEVEDDGCGMDADTVERMFEPFFSTKFTGRGLGLAAVGGIVRSHGGWVDVDSEVGRGTRCSVFLPVAADAADVAQQGVGRAMSRGDGGGEVLVVDDDATVRRLFDRVLRRWGYVPVLADNGADGLAKFEARAEVLAAVFLDITMPAMDGHEVLVKARAISQRVPIVLMSGFAEDRASPEETSFARFLHKPFDTSTLSEILDEIVVRPRRDAPGESGPRPVSALSGQGSIVDD